MNLKMKYSKVASENAQKVCNNVIGFTWSEGAIDISLSFSFNG